MPSERNEVSYYFNTYEFTQNIDDNVLEDANYAAGEIALEAIKQYASERKSTVKGINGKYQKLSDDYAKYKQKTVGNKTPNLELTGSMLDNLELDSDDDGFIIRVNDADVEKAYNHQVGDTVPARQFLPFDDGTFKDEIVKKIKSELKKYESGKTKAKEVKKEFTPVNNADFNKLLNEYNKSKENYNKKYDINKVSKLTDFFK